VTVRFAEAADALLTLQVDSAGCPEQATAMLDPVKFAKVSVVVAEPPGEEIISVVGLAVTLGAGGGEMMIENAVLADAGGFSASVTSTAQLNVPFSVGVPEITPEDALSCRPFGKLLPGATNHA
jgi:hypothetical protein